MKAKAATPDSEKSDFSINMGEVIADPPSSPRIQPISLGDCLIEVPELFGEPKYAVYDAFDHQVVFLGLER